MSAVATPWRERPAGGHRRRRDRRSRGRAATCRGGRAGARRRARGGTGRQDAPGRASARPPSTPARPCSRCAGSSTNCSPRPAPRSSARSACEPLTVLARHAWDDGARLDLFADAARTADGDRRLRRRRRRARLPRVQRPRAPHLRDARTPLPARAAAAGRGRSCGAADGGICPTSCASRRSRACGPRSARHFRDPRLRQLFGRYATYCGASPYLAPATLMLIAHVEQDGVWSVRGGMHALARALTRTAQARGAQFRFDAEVRRVCIEGGRTVGVRARERRAARAPTR